jgi:hypothetical protein
MSDWNNNTAKLMALKKKKFKPKPEKPAPQIPLAEKENTK